LPLDFTTMRQVDAGVPTACRELRSRKLRPEAAVHLNGSLLVVLIAVTEAAAAAAVVELASAAAFSAFASLAATAFTVAAIGTPPAATSSTAAEPTSTAAAAKLAARTAGGSFLARPCLGHGQRPAFARLAMQLADRLLRVGIARHRHERESARTSREFVHHDLDVCHSAGLREVLRQAFVGCGKRYVADIQSVPHRFFPPLRHAALIVSDNRISNCP
jgi:hypothetical protein